MTEDDIQMVETRVYGIRNEVTFRNFAITEDGFDRLFKSHDLQELKENRPEILVQLLEEAEEAYCFFVQTKDADGCCDGYSVSRDPFTHETLYEGHYDPGMTDEMHRKVDVWFEYDQSPPYIFYEDGEPVLKAETSEKLTVMVEEYDASEPEVIAPEASEFVL